MAHGPSCPPWPLKPTIKTFCYLPVRCHTFAFSRWRGGALRGAGGGTAAAPGPLAAGVLAAAGPGRAALRPRRLGPGRDRLEVPRADPPLTPGPRERGRPV